MKQKLNLLIIFASFCISHLSAQPERGFTGWLPATSWENALLAGNGTMGAMVYGFPHDEIIVFNHAKMYLPMTKITKTISQAQHLEEIRELLFEGKYAEAAKIPVEISMDEGYGGLIWSDPFVPAFDMNIRMAASNVSEYQRGVDYATGETFVKWTDENGRFERRLFISRPDNIVVCKISGDGRINGTLTLAPRQKDWEQTIICREYIKEEHSWAEGDFIGYETVFTNQWDRQIQGLYGVSKVFHKGGKITNRNNSIVIEDAEEVTFVLRIEPDFDISSSEVAAIRSDISEFSEGYNALLDKHKEVYTKMYNRTKLKLGENEKKEIQSEALVLTARAGKINNQLIETIFDAARYNNIASTGIMPPNLQGIWGGIFNPPWSSDYTHDGNLPVATESYLCANTPELMKAFFDYHENNLPQYRENAKRLYNCRGIIVPSHSSIHGHNVHFNETWCLSFWTGGAGWTANFFYDYYLYTEDKAFLKKHAYPFLKETALFYEDFLILGEDGKYIFSPSYSPENTPRGSDSQACINATMDVMIAIQVLKNCIAAANILDTDSEKVAQWQAMLRKMPEYQVGKKGGFREWLWPGLENNNQHRHLSHFYSMYEMCDPDIMNNDKLLTALKHSFDERMAFRRQENGGEMAFGLVQLGFVAANLGMSDEYYEIVSWLAGNYWNSSLASYHNPGNLFNADIAGGFQALIIRALVYSEPGMISLLPALPKPWKTGSITGVLLRGNLELSELYWSEESLKAAILPGKSQSLTVRFPHDIEKLSLTGADSERIDPTTYRITLVRDQKAEIVAIY